MFTDTRSRSQIHEDPSIPSHLQTLQTQTKNIPRLKYALACIATSFAYNNSNRHYNITAISKPTNFKQIVSIIIHYQDQKVLEESLSILNVLLNQGNDLTIQQQSDIMHSLSYVNVNNENDKGFVSDRLVQEILFLTYKLKTKTQLSQFISSLMAEKMTASQAKKFIKQLKKQQLKSIQISDLIKIGFKFKTNVLLMTEILNLIYEKVFTGRQQHESKKLFDFLPKIVQQNIEEQSISYKCLQIYKLIQKANPTIKLDPMISRYLESLLKYKKDVFLPLKREFVNSGEDFVRIVEFGKEFEIYHLLVVEYLVRNGYRGGKEQWRTALEQKETKCNPKLREICLRIDGLSQNKKTKSTISQSDEQQYLSLLPIEVLIHPQSNLQKLLSQPTISNSLHVIKHLHTFAQPQQLLLTIHKIALKQKQFNLVKQIQTIVKETFNEQFVFNQVKNVTKVKHKIVLKGQLYFIWLPLLIKDEKLLQKLQKELIEIMSYESIQLEEKFYVMQYIIENRLQKVSKQFLLFLNRQLQSLSAIEQPSYDQGELIFTQIKHYLKHAHLQSNNQIVQKYLTQSQSHLERTAELLFSKLVDYRSLKLTSLLFQLENWNFYNHLWKLPYRWILTALEEVSEHNPDFTLDCLELLQMAIENIDPQLIPQIVKQRFMKIVIKNWSRLESQHLFAIQRIIQILWPNHQYPITQSLKDIKPIYDLIAEQQSFNKKNEYFFESEHPTSLFLQNLQQSHFFGIISQQQFIRNILQLYDKRYNETKRFTEKNVISLMNFIIWLYQYSQEDMQKGLCEMTMAFLSYRSQTATMQLSSYNIRKKCIEIIAVVSHSINLLKLPLRQLLETYIGEKTVMHNLNEIIQTIIESRPQFISDLRLETIVESVMLGLVTCEDMDLIQEYIDFIEAVCYIQESPYSVMFEQSMPTLYQILKAEHKMVEKYRKSLVLFVVDILRHYEFNIQEELLWILMSKYFVQEELQISILETILKQRQHQKSKQKKPILHYENEKLLVRLIMQHNSNKELITMAQDILNTSERTERPIAMNIQTTKQQQPSVSSQKPLLNAQQQFLHNFKLGNYPACQSLLPEIRNPFFEVARQELIKFITCKQLDHYQNLFSFLIKNPSTRPTIITTPEFYLQKESLPEIYKLADLLSWTEENMEKVHIQSFDRQNIDIKTQPIDLVQSIKATITKLFSTPALKPSIYEFMHQLKSPKHQLFMLEFYSKCLLSPNKNMIIEIIDQLNLPHSLQLMRLHIPSKIDNAFEQSTNLLIYHLFVHLSHTMNSQAEIKSEEKYIRDIAAPICTHEMIKNIPHMDHFFVNLSTNITSTVSSKSNIILEQLVELANNFLLVFDGQSMNGSKVIDIKHSECVALLCALLFLHKNGENIHIGVAGKVLQALESKLGDNEVQRQIYDYLISSEPKVDPLRKKSQAVQSKPSNLTQIMKQKQGHKVVFAKQSPKQQQPLEAEKQQQVSQAFQKGKQLQEYMSVAPRQVKALAQKNQQKQKQKQKEQLINQSVQKSIQLVDQQSLIRPKQVSFDEKTFYQATSTTKQQPSSTSISQKQRKQLLQSIRLKQTEQISIATLKQHAKFISSLLQYPQLTRQQLQELMKSIDNITSTVNQHHYYVKKLVELQVTFKLIRLYKRKDIVIPKDMTHFSDMFESKLLTLHHAMSYKKQRKTIVFDDQLTIQFFKLIIKKSLNLKTSRNQNVIILDVVNYCIKSIDAFFKQGLISMLIELLKIDLNSEDVLKFFCRIQLSKHIIFEIYQRGLLTKFVDVFTKSSDSSPVILNRWIRLAGKICTTVAIQEKYLEKGIHKLVWQKHNKQLEQDIEGKKNVAFFFAMLVKKNHKVFEYLVENQIQQKLLQSLSQQNSEQLHMLFHSSMLDNPSSLQYSFRIKYHLHLIEQLTPKPDPKPKSKFFFKSLGQLMSNKQHQALFFKQNIIQKLIKQYELKTQPSIYECLLDFIVTLDNDKEFEQLKRQGFWQCLGLFEYKLSSEATYAYILQIFLVMIKKGRIKQFNTPQIRGKVTLKAQYSINLEGKQLALRFITALSIRTKQCYITERCIRLLSSLVGFRVTSNELDLIEDVLDVEGMLENYELMEFCCQYEVTQNICCRFKTFNERQMLSALKILNILGTQAKNNKVLREKLFMPIMDKLKHQLSQQNSSLVIQQWLLKVILVIVSYKQSKQAAQRLDLGKFLLEVLDKITTINPKDRKKILDQYVAIVQTCRQNAILPLNQLQKILQKLNMSKIEKEIGKINEIKQQLKGEVQTQSILTLKTMTQGIPVKMYKNDGSSSDLLLFLTDDKLQLNCTIQKGQPVKQKWRLVLSEISQIISYQNQKQYQTSAFSKAGGLFSRAPEKKLCLTAKSKNNQFNMFFNTKEDKQKWKKYIEFAVNNSKKILHQFK